MVAVLIVCQTAVGADAGAGAPLAEWPRVLYRDGVTNTIYQPQLVSWDYVTLKAISAVAIQPKGAPQATFGTIELQAKTTVARELSLGRRPGECLPGDAALATAHGSEEHRSRSPRSRPSDPGGAEESGRPAVAK